MFVYLNNSYYQDPVLYGKNWFMRIDASEGNNSYVASLYLRIFKNPKDESLIRRARKLLKNCDYEKLVLLPGLERGPFAPKWRGLHDCRVFEISGLKQIDPLWLVQSTTSLAM